MKHHAITSIVAVFLSGAPLWAESTLNATAEGDTIRISRKAGDTTLVVQNAAADHRPFLHPIMAPDGKGELTQYSPGHHPHQTGLYWGFTRVNSRDYFHHPKDNYWKHVATSNVTLDGAVAVWRVTYDLLDAAGMPILRQEHQWTLTDHRDHFTLDIDWTGTAHVDTTVGKYNYGGLFLRMPYDRKTGGKAVNSEGLENGHCEGKTARWVDTGMPIKGRDDWGHIVIMDHPMNEAHPSPWRVDGQLGVGPCRARLGDWSIAKDESAAIRYRLLVYTGDFNAEKVESVWKDYQTR